MSNDFLQRDDASSSTSVPPNTPTRINQKNRLFFHDGAKTMDPYQWVYFYLMTIAGESQPEFEEKVKTYDCYLELIPLRQAPGEEQSMTFRLFGPEDLHPDYYGEYHDDAGFEVSRRWYTELEWVDVLFQGVFCESIGQFMSQHGQFKLEIKWVKESETLFSQIDFTQETLPEPDDAAYHSEPLYPEDT